MLMATSPRSRRQTREDRAHERIREAWVGKSPPQGSDTALKRSLSLPPGTRKHNCLGACGARGVYSARSAVIGSILAHASRAASTRGRLRARTSAVLLASISGFVLRSQESWTRGSGPIPRLRIGLSVSRPRQARALIHHRPNDWGTTPHWRSGCRSRRRSTTRLLRPRTDPGPRAGAPTPSTARPRQTCGLRV